jgi:adenylate kinase
VAIPHIESLKGKLISALGARRQALLERRATDEDDRRCADLVAKLSRHGMTPIELRALIAEWESIWDNFYRRYESRPRRRRSN